MEDVFPPPRGILEGHGCSLQTCVTPAFATIQIMVGLFYVGLGLGRTSTHPGDVSSLGAAYWLGAVFIASGVLTILAGKFPSSCLSGFSAFVNIVGAIFSITAIVLFSVDLANSSLLWMCDPDQDSCRKVALLAQRLLTYTDVTLIVLAVLQLVVSIWVTVLGVVALVVGAMKREEVQAGVAT